MTGSNSSGTSRIQELENELLKKTKKKKLLSPEELYELMAIAAELEDEDPSGYDPTKHLRKTKLIIQRKRSKSRYFLLVAVLVCVLLLTVFASAQGGYLSSSPHWNLHVFSLQPIDNDFSKDAVTSGANALQDTLDGYRIEQFSAPIYIPEGYSFDTVSQNATDDWISIYAAYKNDAGQVISILIETVMAETVAVYEKLAGPVEQIAGMERTYYYVENTENNSLVWSDAPFQICVMGTIVREEMIKVADSMYEMEES